jgi:hypothetical protein
MDDEVTCLVCGETMRQVTWLHLRRHGSTVDEYRAAYPGAPLVSPATTRRRSQASPLRTKRGFERTEEYRAKRADISREMWKRPGHAAKVNAGMGRVDWSPVAHVDRRVLNAFHKRFECSRQWGTPIAPTFTHDVAGLLAFHAEVGDVPAGMERPTIGRRDHAKGYEPGNMEWQEGAENERESIVRNHERLRAARAAAKARKLADGLPLRVETVPRRSRREADQRRIAAEKAAAVASRGA